MPPVVALLICTGFVVYLLRFDRRESAHISSAVWLPTLWTFAVASKPLGRWLDSGGSDTIEAGSRWDQIFWTMALCLGMVILSKRRINWSAVFKENGWLFTLIGFMLLSTLWSDIPFISFKRWVKELTALVMALVVLSEQRPREALLAVLRRTSYVLIPYSLLLIRYYPYYGVEFHRWSGERMWIGVTPQKNGLGRLCVIVAFYLFWVFLRRWKGRDVPVGKFQTHAEVLLLGLTLYLLKGPPGAYPATALVVLGVGVVTYLGMLWMRRNGMRLQRGLLTGGLALLIVLGTVTPLVGGATVAGLTSTLGRNSTLTGRTDIWKDLLRYVVKRPILGSGHGGFWTTQTWSEIGVGEAHNGYLEVLLNIGAIGLLINAMFLLSCGWQAHRILAVDFDWGCLFLCFLLMTVLHNYTEASIESFERHLMANLLFLAMASRVASLKSPARQFQTIKSGRQHVAAPLPVRESPAPSV